MHNLLVLQRNTCDIEHKNSTCLETHGDFVSTNNHCVCLLLSYLATTATIRQSQFSTCDQDAGHLATKILKESKQTSFMDADRNANEDGKAWIEKCSGACVKALNDLRNEVTSGMQAEWKNYYTEHGKLPTIEEFTDVVMRICSIL